MSLFNTKSATVLDQPLKGQGEPSVLQQQIEAQIAALTKVLDDFHKKPLKEVQDELRLALDIIATVDAALDGIDTNESLFIKRICQPLEQYRRQAKDWYDAHAAELKAASEPKKASEYQMPVYVSLYQANAHRLESWQHVLQNLSSQVVTLFLCH